MWDTCSCRSESVRDVRGPDLLRICVFFQKRITVNNCGYRIRQSEGHRRPYRLGQSRRCAASRDARIPSRYLAKRPCCFVPGRGRNEPKPRNTPLNTVTIPRYSGSAIAWFLEPGGEGPDQHPATPRADHPNWPVVRGRPAAHPGGEPDDVDQNTHTEPGRPRGFHVPAFLLSPLNVTGIKPECRSLGDRFVVGGKVDRERGQVRIRLGNLRATEPVFELRLV
jgi:hypothetical protein